MTGRTLADEILAAARHLVDGAIEGDPALVGSVIMAIGWATVELDRAERELADALAPELGEPVRWAPAGRDLGPGAAARRGPALDGLPLILLEPDTEGRLAAILARHGEGVGAVYVRTPAGIDLVLVPDVTSAPGVRAPTALAGRPPSAVG
jgi:hypothetical protein